MRRTIFLLCVLLGAGGTAANAASGAGRSQSTCGEYLAQIAKTSAGIGVKNKILSGSWGTLPPELRKVPPGGEHCGTVESTGPGGNAVVIRSPLFGKDLETFYGPLFSKLGCAPLKCKVKEASSKARTLCYCQGPKGAGSISTDESVQMYSLNVF